MSRISEYSKLYGGKWRKWEKRRNRKLSAAYITIEKLGLEISPTALLSLFLNSDYFPVTEFSVFLREIERGNINIDEVETI